MNNQKIPDASTMAQLAKDRVAAQVNQMGANDEKTAACLSPDIRCRTGAGR
jgi:hypothetical protein